MDIIDEKQIIAYKRLIKNAPEGATHAVLQTEKYLKTETRLLAYSEETVWFYYTRPLPDKPAYWDEHFWTLDKRMQSLKDISTIVDIYEAN